MIKYYNSGMGVVDLLVQKTATYWLNPKSSGGWYYLRFFFLLDLMNMCMVKDITQKEWNYWISKLLLQNPWLRVWIAVKEMLLLSAYNGVLSYQLTYHFNCQLSTPQTQIQVMLCWGTENKTSNITHVVFTFVCLPGKTQETVLLLSTLTCRLHIINLYVPKTMINCSL